MRISDWSSDVCSSDLDHDELGHEAQRCFVDRGRGLDHAEHQAGEQRRDQDRRRGERQDPESLLRDADEIVGLFHRYTPLKEAASEPIVSAHPSTRTNSSSLNGIEMNDVDSIIMRSAISDEAATRPVTRKGGKNRRPTRTED